MALISVWQVHQDRHFGEDKELEMEGARISWDELTCVGYPVSEEATEKLCQDIEKFRKKAGMSEHSVKKEQLINWKILKQSEGQLLATNAYALLTSDYFFILQNTMCGIQGNRSCNVSG